MEKNIGFGNPTKTRKNCWKTVGSDGYGSFESCEVPIGFPLV